MNILGTGLSGLVGARLVDVMPKEWIFENLSLETGVDITNKHTVDNCISRTRAPWVFHFAAYTDVDGAQKQHGDTSGSVWNINVRATEYLVNACKISKKRLLYISTDYVFDGTKHEYTEHDVPNPVGWYAITKHEGEKRVLALGSHALVVRIANPYCAHSSGKMDFVHRILDYLLNGRKIEAPTDQFFIPTYIDDIARAIHRLVIGDESGIYHVVGSQLVTPYSAACRIAQTYGLPLALVQKTTFQKFFSGRSNRPLRSNLKNDKITKLGVKMRTFDQGITDVYNQSAFVNISSKL